MLVIRTPLRVSFAGGFGDVVAQHVGGRLQVLSCTVQLYVWIVVTGQEDGSLVASYSKIEHVSEAPELGNALFRATLAECKVDRGIQIHSISRLPISSCGLGGSAAACVGLVNALHVLRSTHLAPSVLAETAARVEIQALGKKVGKQDQYAAAYGGLNLLTFDGERVTVEAQEFELVRETLNDRCLLVPCLPPRDDAGASPRSASALLAEQVADGAGVAAEMSALVNDAMRAFHAHDPAMLGGVVNAGWDLKRRLSTGVPTKDVDYVIDEVRRAGGGAKLCGAGGGGYVLAVFPDVVATADFMGRHPVSIPVRWEPYGSTCAFDDWERIGGSPRR